MTAGEKVVAWIETTCRSTWAPFGQLVLSEDEAAAVHAVYDTGYEPVSAAQTFLQMRSDLLAALHCFEVLRGGLGFTGLVPDEQVAALVNVSPLLRAELQDVFGRPIPRDDGEPDA